jgi:hypothetical protein
MLAPASRSTSRSPRPKLSDVRRRETWHLNFWRLWLPVAMCLFGIVILITDGFDLFGVSAFAAFVGAGLSVALTNFLWRIGITGNLDRDDEEAARRYLAEHGHWPEDRPPPDPEA